MQLIWRHFHLSAEVSLCETHIFPRLFKFSMGKSTRTVYGTFTHHQISSVILDLVPRHASILY